MSGTDCVDSIDDARVDEAIRSQEAHGYFGLAGLIEPAGVRRLNAAIDAIAGRQRLKPYSSVKKVALSCLSGSRSFASSSSGP